MKIEVGHSKIQKNRILSEHCISDGVSSFSCCFLLFCFWNKTRLFPQSPWCNWKKKIRDWNKCQAEAQASGFMERRQALPPSPSSAPVSEWSCVTWQGHFNAQLLSLPLHSKVKSLSDTSMDSKALLPYPVL